MGVCVLVFLAAFSFPAFADQSIGFKQYFNEGVKAFKEHDDQKALRCFKLAQIYDPTDEDLKEYYLFLSQRGVVLELPVSRLPPEKSIGYKYYFENGIKAFRQYDDEKAIRYFKIAKIFYPGSKESDRYLRILYQRQGLNFLPENENVPAVPSLPQAVAPQITEQAQLPENIPKPLPQAQAAVEVPAVSSPSAVVPSMPEQVQYSANTPNTTRFSNAPSQAATEAPAVPVPQAQTAAEVPAAVPLPQTQTVVQPQAYSPPVQPQQAAIVPPSALYVPPQRAKEPVEVISLDLITKHAQIKPRLQIALQSSVIIEGKNIQRFLIVDEGFIGVRSIDLDHLESTR